VLLSGPAGDGPRAAEEAGRELGLSIDVHRFGEDLDGDDLGARHGIGPEGALLVRPDGFVAWRGEDAVSGTQLAGVLRRLLCR
jgi:hypothetical protein